MKNENFYDKKVFKQVLEKYGVELNKQYTIKEAAKILDVVYSKVYYMQNKLKLVSQDYAYKEFSEKKKKDIIILKESGLFLLIKELGKDNINTKCFNIMTDYNCASTESQEKEQETNLKTIDLNKVKEEKANKLEEEFNHNMNPIFKFLTEVIPSPLEFSSKMDIESEVEKIENYNKLLPVYLERGEILKLNSLQILEIINESYQQSSFDIKFIDNKIYELVKKNKERHDKQQLGILISLINKYKDHYEKHFDDDAFEYLLFKIDFHYDHSSYEINSLEDIAKMAFAEDLGFCLCDIFTNTFK